ncbi:hypothetical protein M0805_003265 [Coniferiporia weirii]|nr:hypothetical protein M0805_003265 [Coniferiporia weirii]
MLPVPKTGTSMGTDVFFDDDEEGWEDMPIIRDDFANGLDEEDKKKYRYVTPDKQHTVNATGNLIDFDESGREWREKLVTNESEYSEYTRLRLNEEDDNDEVHLRTKFLFDEDKAMTPLSQMQATKNMLTESQRVAYVGLCALVVKEMALTFKLAKHKELKPALDSLELWSLKIMGRLFYHMELETAEQKMIESLAEHGVQATDLVPSLLTTRTVANPEYDPAEEKKQETAKREAEEDKLRNEEALAEDITEDLGRPKLSPTVPMPPMTPTTPSISTQTTANVLPPSAPETLPGVSTTLSAADKDVTLDIRWTVLCDLFLILIADSVYDSRSRVLLEAIAYKLGLGWLDVVRFEQRVTEALEIQEGVEKLEQKEVIEGRIRAAKKRRYAMLGLATLGGGLVIGLSAGLLAPVIGAGLGAAFTTIGVSGTSAFLAGTGGAAVITTAGTLTGSGIAARGMARRTRDVRTFDLLPLHNNKRVNCILTVSGFMTSPRDDVRLPFSVLDPIVGDVFSVLWEPEMLGETGSALRILTSEVLSQVGQTVLQATVMTALMSALQWPILLTKLGYLIDNPWSNALDRSRAAGLVLADVLMRRHLGVRPITLIGFSLGTRVIFYCLLELARHKAFGIVQDVFILGATLTANRQAWLQARSVVSGRFVNGFARSDWVLNYLFRATSGGLQNIAGLRPVLGIPGLENVDVTDKIAGHMSYRSFMPLILDQLGFPVSADYFDEPEEPDMEGDRIVVREEDGPPKKKSWFTRRANKKEGKTPRPSPQSPLGLAKNSSSPSRKAKDASDDDDDLPERLEHSTTSGPPFASPAQSPPSSPRASDVSASTASVPIHAGFDLKAIQEVIVDAGGAAVADVDVLHAPFAQTPFASPLAHEPSGRAESAPPPAPAKDSKTNTGVETDTRRSVSPVSHARPNHARSRVTSTPLFSSASGFGEDELEEPEEGSDIGSALGPSAGPSGLRARRDYDESGHNFSEPDAGGADTSLNFGPSGSLRAPYWDNGAFGGTSASERFHAWSSGSKPTRTESGVDAPTLSFGGPNGSVWDVGPSSDALSLSFASSSNAARGSLAGGFSSMSLSPSPPPPALPQDILNPFAMSSTDLGSRGGGDAWRAPPLTTSTNARVNINAKAKQSTLNVNANPWG